jgi:hypothetical protein
MIYSFQRINQIIRLRVIKGTRLICKSAALAGVRTKATKLSEVAPLSFQFFYHQTSQMAGSTEFLFS